MKKIVLLCCGVFGILSACKKDIESAPSFDKITYQMIKTNEAQLAEEVIRVYDPQLKEMIIKQGSVILYKTSQGLFGKLKLKSVSEDGKVVFDYLNYDANGQQIGNVQEAYMNQNDTFDFDTGVLQSDDVNSDVYWTIASHPGVSASFGFHPQTTAAFLVYK